MALTKTPICEFGKKAEKFELNSTENKLITLDDVKGKNSELRLGGLVSSSKILFDKRNNQWAIITLERMSSKAEIFIFSDLFNKVKDLIHENN